MYYRASLSVVTLRQFLKELCSFVNLEYRKCAVFHTFLLHALRCWAEILHRTLFKLMYLRSSSSVITLQPSGSPSVHHFSELATNMHWQLTWNFKFHFDFFNAFLLEKRYIKKPFKMFMTGVLCTVCGAQVYLDILLTFHIMHMITISFMSLESYWSSPRIYQTTLVHGAYDGTKRLSHPREWDTLGWDNFFPDV